LPEKVGTPRRGEREITLFDLATHTSGLPRTDPKYGPLDNSKAYAEYTIDELYRFLGGYELTRDIGERYEYSNIGFGLLGHALALAAGLSFEELLRERITGPLGMTSTAVTPTPSMQPRLASGHDAALEPVPRFELSVLAGAGALLSTANDLVKFISAEIGFTHTPLAPAMTAQLAPRLPMNPRGSQTALGWHVTATGAGDEILWHSGSTPGFVSIVCLDKSRRMGVAVLNNRSGGGDNLGFHLLAGTPVRSERVEILLPISELERIAGRYQLTPKAVLQITIEDAQLYTQLIVEDAQRSRPILPIYPESATHFFWKARAGDISFQIDAGGGVNRLWLRQGQAAAERIV
jgi:serine-type D-Ala-D-Ala carboxypeptidase/endopeptidase